MAFEREKEQMTQLPDVEEAIFLRFPQDTAVPAGKVVLDLKLPMLAAGDRFLAERICLHVEGPEKVCIIGRNGVGKTSLLRQIADQLLHRRDLKAAYMPQNYAEQLPDHMTPVEFLNKSGSLEEAIAAVDANGRLHIAGDNFATLAGRERLIAQWTHG